MVPLALGTDTGCSLRLPAAFCGLVSHKPTAGLVPLDGVLPLAPSMDSGGALVRSVGDARLSVELLSGRPLPPAAPVDDLRVGLGLEGDVPPLSAAVAGAVRGAAGTLADLVAAVVPVRVPLIGRGPEIYRGIQAREARAWHTGTGRWPRYADRYGDDVRRRLAACVAMTEAELDEATRLRDQLRAGAAALFAQVDVVLMPVASTGPGLVRDPDRVTTDGQDGDLRAAVLPWTVPANLGGWPAVAVPVARPAGSDADGLPIGLQIVGPPGGDARVLDVAEVLTAALAPGGPAS
jgi:aspartyl-tRNA(Asn)/glutamyl-tRNA(Gln) amidotransferase subunit A